MQQESMIERNTESTCMDTNTEKLNEIQVQVVNVLLAVCLFFS